MPLVHVYYWEGHGAETAATVIKEITQVFVDLGAPAQNVTVLVHETPKTHWGEGGKPSSEETADE